MQTSPSVHSRKLAQKNPAFSDENRENCGTRPLRGARRDELRLGTPASPYLKNANASSARDLAQARPRVPRLSSTSTPSEVREPKATFHPSQTRRHPPARARIMASCASSAIGFQPAVAWWILSNMFGSHSPEGAVGNALRGVPGSGKRRLRALPGTPRSAFPIEVNPSTLPPWGRFPTSPKLFRGLL